MPLKDTTPKEEYKLKRDQQGNLIHRERTFSARISKDGTLQIEDNPNFQFDLEVKEDEEKNKKLQLFTFDVTDAVMRMAGQDPYLAQKRCFARATEKLRDELRQEHIRQTFAAGQKTTAQNLEQVWRKNVPHWQKLRRTLFELWDECEEAYPADPPALASSTEKQRRQHGEEARQMIVCFIRQKLPCGSPQAYSEAELRRLNTIRKSRQIFRPYGELSFSCQAHPFS